MKDLKFEFNDLSEKCDKCDNIGEREELPCPRALELANCEELCNCCDDCRIECARSV